MTRTTRSLWTVASGWAQSLVTMVVGLAATPLLIKYLGNERYGATLFAIQCGVFFILLELGRGVSVRPILIRGLTDPNELNKVMPTVLRSWRWITVLTMLGLVVSMFLVPSLLKGTSAVERDLRWSYVVGAPALLFTLLIPMRYLLEASHRGYYVSLAITAQSVVTTLVSLFIAWLTHSRVPDWQLTWCALANIAGAAVSFMVIQRVATQKFPGMFRVWWRGKSDPAIHDELSRNGRRGLILQLARLLGLTTDNIVVGVILGPAIVPVIFLTQRLIAIAQGQLATIGSSVWAPLGDLYARGEHDRFRTRLIQVSKLVVILGVACMAPLMAYNQHFVTKWVGLSQYAGDFITGLSCMNAVIYGLFVLWALALDATGHVNARVKVSLAFAIVNIVLSIVATLVWGMAGPMFALFVANVSVNMWCYPLLMRRLFQLSVKSLFFAVMKPLWIGVPLSIGLWYWAQYHTPWGWIGLGAEMALGATIYLVLCWFLVVNRDDRGFVLERFRRRTAPAA